MAEGTSVQKQVTVVREEVLNVDGDFGGDYLERLAEKEEATIEKTLKPREQQLSSSTRELTPANQKKAIADALQGLVTSKVRFHLR